MRRGLLVCALLAGCIADIDGDLAQDRYTAESRHTIGPFVVGEVMVDHEWKKVSFGRSIADPVVVAGPPSTNGTQPGVVRIRNVTSTGFEIRVHEWSYLDGRHYPEAIGYIAARRGKHQLDEPNMSKSAMQVELGTVKIDLKPEDTTLHRHTFDSQFNDVPIILATVTTFTGSDTVVSRIADVDQQGFSLALQEEEAAEQSHTDETVSYLAITRGTTTVDGHRFAVGVVSNVTHEHARLSFDPFASMPVVFASMQTTNGGNTANLRWKSKAVGSVLVQVSEEQSADLEVEHLPEDVGYLAIGKVKSPDTGPCKTVFLDVMKDSGSETPIYTVYHLGVMQGCKESPPLFCNAQKLTRAEIAKPLLLAMHGSSYEPPPAEGLFEDVDKDTDDAPWIEQLYREGITTGCKTSPLRFCPATMLTRRTLAPLLLRAKHGKGYKPPPATGLFTDVAAGDKMRSWMEQLYREEITTGCKKTPLQYCPKNQVGKAGLAIFLVKTFKLEDNVCGGPPPPPPPPPEPCGVMPTYVDLAVGGSTIFRTADNKQHQIKLLSQSLDRVEVSVDGVKSVFELEQARCGSPGRQLPREISGVLVLPEVVSDLQKAGACKDLSLNRRWNILSFSWDTGDADENKDDDKPGYARLRLFDPAQALFQGVFPITGYKTCTAMLNSVWRPYLVPSSYGFHHGVDVSLPRGTPIVATRPGTITRLNNTCKPDEQTSSTCPGCGNWVQIDDGHFIYQYCHLRKHDASLQLGQKVKLGQKLGVSGNTGLSGGPHLHFTIIHKAGIAPVNRRFWTNAFPFMDAWCKQQTCR